VTHHTIANANAQMPLMLYQAGVNAGTMAYRPEVLAELAQLPNVVGIKEGSWEAAAYETNRRLVKRVAPQVAMMASNCASGIGSPGITPRMRRVSSSKSQMNSRPVACFV